MSKNQTPELKAKTMPAVGSSLKTPMNIDSVKTIEDFLLAELGGAAEDHVHSTVVSYHEMAEVPLRKQDMLEQFEANMLALKDLRSRLQFMNREIRYLLRV